MAATRLTPTDLIDRLLEVYEVDDVNEIQDVLPNAVRTIQRWKEKGFPVSAAALLEMLYETGYLTDEVDERQASSQRAKRLAARIADDAAALADLL